MLYIFHLPLRALHKKIQIGLILVVLDFMIQLTERDPISSNRLDEWLYMMLGLGNTDLVRMQWSFNRTS